MTKRLEAVIEELRTLPENEQDRAGKALSFSWSRSRRYSPRYGAPRERQPSIAGRRICGRA
jgi:hypothetical protein